MAPRIGIKAPGIVLAVLAATGVATVAAQAPASASTFTATYSCSVPIVGTETATVDATLTATPNPATAGSAVSFALDVSSISLAPPLEVYSWSATAAISGSGAESSSFDATGSGGELPAGEDISDVDLSGSWTPSVDGTDTFVIGDIDITADVELLGDETVTCTPSGTQPTAETLTVG
jgi:hypothetical protein